MVGGWWVSGEWLDDCVQTKEGLGAGVWQWH